MPVLLALLFGVLPLFQLPFVLDGTLISRFVMVAAVLAIGYYSLNSPISLSWTTCLLGGYLLWTALSILWARNFAEALFETQRTFLFFAAFLWLQEVLAVWADAEQYLFRSLLVANTALLVVGVIQLSQAESLALKHLYAVTGVQGHKNLFASFLFLCMPFGFLGLRKEQNTSWRTAFASVLFLNGVLMALLQTRAVYVGIAVGILVGLLVVAIGLRKAYPLASSAKTMCWFVLSLVIGLLVAHGSTFLQHKQDEQGKQRFASTSERVMLLKKTWPMLKEHGLFGVGAGNWQVEFPAFGLEGIGMAQVHNVTFQRPHNDFVWIVSEVGLVGLALYLSFFLLLVGNSLRRLADPTADVGLRLEIGILLSALLGFLAIAFFDFPKERIGHLVLWAALLALLQVRLGNPKPIVVLPSYTRWAFLLVLCATMVTGLYRMRGEMHTRYVYAARAQSNWPTLVRYCTKASSRFYTLDPTSIPLDWYKGVAHFSMNDHAAAIVDFESAYRLTPWNFHILNNLASAYEVTGQHAKAIPLYQEAIRINPLFDEAKLNLFVIYYNAKQFDQCVQIIHTCQDDSERKKVYVQLLTKLHKL